MGRDQLLGAVLTVAKAQRSMDSLATTQVEALEQLAQEEEHDAYWHHHGGVYMLCKLGGWQAPIIFGILYCTYALDA